jgi:hypothetical protein
MESAGRTGERVVAVTGVGGLQVSTVFVGTDLQIDPPPAPRQVFETLVFERWPGRHMP